VYKDKYDPSYFLRYDYRNRKRVKAIIQNLSPCFRVLDIGCNRGYFSKAVLGAELSSHVDAVEINKDVVEPILLKDSRFTLYESDIVDFTFPATYTAIIYGAVHHHVFGHRGYLEAFKLWQRIVENCERHIFFETGQLLEGSRWYWQRAIRKYYSGDEEYIGALLQAVGPRLKRVKIINKHRIHGIYRWLMRIDLRPIDPLKGSAKIPPETMELNCVKIDTYRRTIGSQRQKLVSLNTINTVSSVLEQPNNENLYEGSEYSLYQIVDSGEKIWCKKSLDDPYKDKREYFIGTQVDEPLFVCPIAYNSEIGLVFNYVDCTKLSQANLKNSKNRKQFINCLLDLFDYASKTMINIGDMDLNPRERGGARRLIDIVDMHSANFLVESKDSSLQLSALIDFEYFCNHNIARNSFHFTKIILNAHIISIRILLFLCKTLYWNFVHNVRWTFAPVEDRLYEKYNSRLRYLIMRIREISDRMMKFIPNYWQ